MKTFFYYIFFLFSFCLSAQTNNVLYLWPNEVPGETEPKHKPVQTGNTKGNVIRITDVTNPSLTVYKPKIANESKAGIIVCPGGGYSILAINKEGYEIAEWLNSLGYTAFVLKYRVPNKRKGALQDVQRAIKLVRSKADVYNLDSKKIGLMGFSAGGHLSALASVNHEVKSYKNENEIDKRSCLPNFTMLLYPAYLDKGENRTISPEFVFSNETPPFFIFGTTDDKYGNSSLAITTALRDRKIPVELHLLAKGGHGYGLRKGNVAGKTWPSLAEVWLKNTVKSKTLNKKK